LGDAPNILLDRAVAKCTGRRHASEGVWEAYKPIGIQQLGG